MEQFQTLKMLLVLRVLQHGQEVFFLPQSVILETYMVLHG